MTRTLYLDTACAAFPARGTDWEPHCVRVAAILEEADSKGDVAGRPQKACYLVQPRPAWAMTDAAALYHKATLDDFKEGAISGIVAATGLAAMARRADVMVAHNMIFHGRMAKALCDDFGGTPVLPALYCTMANSMDVVKLPTKNTSGYKPPKLSEAFKHFTHADMPVHDGWHLHGLEQVRAVRAVYKGLTAP